MRLRCLLFYLLYSLTDTSILAQDNPQGIEPRNGVPCFLMKLARKQPVTVAYLGGSITAAEGYRLQTTDYLKTIFPGSSITPVNAGVGGTGSSLGVFRLQYDVLRFHPDLVFVEFAVNDAGGDSVRICRAMEGIVRQIKKADPATDICFLYTINEPMVRIYRKDDIPGSVRFTERIASHYQLPSVNLAYDVLRLEEKDSLIFHASREEKTSKVTFTVDGTHPLPAGHEVYTTTIRNAFGLMRRQRSKPAKLPPALFVDNLEDATVYPPSRAIVGGNWKPFTAYTALQNFSTDYPEGIYSDNINDSVVINFHGTYFGVGDVLGPSTCGKLLVWIDGELRPIARFDKYCARYRRNYFFIDNLQAGDHRVVIRIDPATVNKKSIIKPDELGDDLKKYAPERFYLGSLLLPAE